jgi:hypothetical protein
MSWLSIIATVGFQVYKTRVMRNLNSEAQEEEVEVTIRSNSKETNPEKDKAIETTIS